MFCGTISVTYLKLRGNMASIVQQSIDRTPVDKSVKTTSYARSLGRAGHGHLVAPYPEDCGPAHGHLVAQTYINTYILPSL